MASRSLGTQRPARPHLVRGRGYAGEVRDLRTDTDAAFEALEDEVDDLDTELSGLEDGIADATAAIGVLDTRLDTVQAGDFSLVEGFYLNVLPVIAVRASILTAATAANNVPLDASRWYSITVEVIIKNPTTSARYVYRHQIEAYRDGGGAVIHLNATPPLTEEPAGGDYSVTLDTTGNNVRVTIANDSANTVNYALYVGYSRKPIPS